MPLADTSKTTTIRRLLFPLGVFLAWLATLAALWMVARAVFGTVAMSYPGAFMRWDAGWYATLAERGYDAGTLHQQTNVVFFPLYPKLVGAVSTIIPLPAAGMVVSGICFLAALVVFFDLVQRRYDARTAKIATALLAFNPFGFFFGLMYTESLFLLLTVSTVWLILERQWWLAAATAGLTSATRSVGLMAGIVLLAQWAYDHKQTLWPLRSIRPWMILAGLGLVSAAGLIAFVVFLQVNNGDALAFIHVQKYWARTGIANLPAELYAYVKGTMMGTLGKYFIFTDTVWLGSTLLGLTGLVMLWRQKEYLLALFVALGLAVPLASGTIGSMSRYTMVLFPLYIAVAKVVRGRWAAAVLTMSFIAFCGFWLLYLEPRYQLFFG